MSSRASWAYLSSNEQYTLYIISNSQKSPTSNAVRPAPTTHLTRNPGREWHQACGVLVESAVSGAWPEPQPVEVRCILRAPPEHLEVFGQDLAHIVVTVDYTKVDLNHTPTLDTLDIILSAAGVAAAKRDGVL